MCVIVSKPKGYEFPESEFDKCWARNGHGVGFVAIDENQKLHTSKGLMIKDEAWNAIKQFTGINCDLVVHFRIQSRGGISPHLTHPFDFSTENEQRFLFHNGTVRPLNVSGQNSDTETLALNVLKPLCNQDVASLLNILAAEKYGKFITVRYSDSGPSIDIYDNRLTTNFSCDEGKNSAIIDGVWYSNTMHNKICVTPQNVGDDFCGSDVTSYYTENSYPDRLRFLLTNRPEADIIIRDASLRTLLTAYHIHQIVKNERDIVSLLLLKK